MANSFESSVGAEGSTEPFLTSAVELGPQAQRVFTALVKHLAPGGELTQDARPHQRAALNDLLEYLSYGHREGYVESATSTGKTYLIAKITEALYREGLRVLILAPRHIIAEQIINNHEKGLKKFAPSLPPDAVSKHYLGSRANPESPVVVATYAGLNNFSQNGELGEFDVVLADEAHRSLGAVTSKNVKGFSPDSTKVAFTATAKYGINKGVDEIFGNSIHTLGLAEAIEMKLVAPVQCLVYTTEDEIPYLDSVADYTPRELERLIELKSRNEAATKFAKNLVADGRQGVISCVPGHNLAHARMLAKELNGTTVQLKNGRTKVIKAATVGGSQFQKSTERAALLKAFEEGELDILTFVDTLTEGWDSSKASFLINTCPTTSVVKKRQQIGRVLREKASGLDSIVVDFLDVSKKHQATALAAIGLETLELGRVHGRSVSDESSSSRRTYLKGLLDDDLWQNLLSIENMRVEDLVLRGSRMTEFDRLAAFYERAHVKAGEPAELGDSTNLSTHIIKAMERYFKLYPRRNYMNPLPEQAATYLLEQGIIKDPEIAQRVAAIALNGFKDDSRPPAEIHYIQRKNDVSDYDPDEEIDQIEAKVFLLPLMGILPARERMTLEMRYGLIDGVEHTLESVGRKLEVTRERARQIEHSGLKHLMGGYYQVPSIEQKTELKRQRLIKDLERQLGAYDSAVGPLKYQRVAILYGRELAQEEPEVAAEVKQEELAQVMLQYRKIQISKVITQDYLNYITANSSAYPASLKVDNDKLSKFIIGYTRQFFNGEAFTEDQLKVATQAFKHLNLLISTADYSTEQKRYKDDSYFSGWLRTSINEAARRVAKEQATQISGTPHPVPEQSYSQSPNPDYFSA